VHHNHVLYVEQVIHFRYRHQGRGGTATPVGHDKYGSRGTNPVACFVENHLARINLVPKILRDRLRDIRCARINAVDHQRLHRDGKVEPVEFGLIEPGLYAGFEFGVFSHFLTPSAFDWMKAVWTIPAAS
jgi:hypothetical protein